MSDTIKVMYYPAFRKWSAMSLLPDISMFKYIPTACAMMFRFMEEYITIMFTSTTLLIRVVFTFRFVYKICFRFLFRTDYPCFRAGSQWQTPALKFVMNSCLSTSLRIPKGYCNFLWRHFLSPVHIKQLFVRYFIGYFDSSSHVLIIAMYLVNVKCKKGTLLCVSR